MCKRWWRSLRLGFLALLGSLLLSGIWVAPSTAHWADLAVAEILVDQTQTQITLTFPTALVTPADTDQNGQLSAAEVRDHKDFLTRYLGDRIQITNGKGEPGLLSVEPLEIPAIAANEKLQPNLSIPTDTHSTLVLTYRWDEPVEGLRVHYDLFLPGVSTASCQTTILQAGHVRSFVFTPRQRQLALSTDSASPWLWASSFVVAIAGSFVWGAMHALSPGHGKTIVGAYLIGSRATPLHALFLALTTTITHTAGVFALGAIVLFASQYILPEQLYPWLSLISGLLVVSIGVNLVLSRLQATKQPHQDTHHHHDHSHTHHHHDHSHTHHHHDHSHTHHHHDHSSHSHLPPGADDTPITWKNLLALGISGGLVPCPSALVMLLSATALGSIGFGLTLVVAFSLGLAGVLTAIGLLLVYAKRLFVALPQPSKMVKVLPLISSLLIALIGIGITARSLVQLGVFNLVL